MFNFDGTRIVTCSEDKTTQIWDVTVGKLIGLPFLHGNFLASAQFSPDGTRIITTIHNEAQILDVNMSRPVIKPLRHDGIVSAAEFSPDGSRIVSVNWKKAQLWDAMTGNPIGKPLDHEDKINSAHFSPDGSRVITASNDNTARLWDTVSGNPVGEPLRHDTWVLDAQFSRDNKRIVTASGTNAKIWNATTGVCVGSSFRHNNLVVSAQFDAVGSHIITASGLIAQIWDVSNGEPIGEPIQKRKLTTAQFSRDDTLIVTVGEDKTARIWNTATFIEAPLPVPEWITGYARAVAGYEFAENGAIQTMEISKQLAILNSQPPGEDRWTALARWIAAPVDKRTLTPDAQFTVRQIAERERDTLLREGIESALRYDTTVPLARLLLGNCIEVEDSGKSAAERNATIPARAAFLRRYDLDRLPDDPVLWTRAAKALNDAPTGAMVGIGHKAIHPATAAQQAAEKALVLKPNDPSAQAELERAKKSPTP
jgi:predicted oxidoreductase (fatty acid repression mutant protein)